MDFERGRYSARSHSFHVIPMLSVWMPQLSATMETYDAREAPSEKTEGILRGTLGRSTKTAGCRDEKDMEKGPVVKYHQNTII